METTSEKLRSYAVALVGLLIILLTLSVLMDSANGQDLQGTPIAEGQIMPHIGAGAHDNSAVDSNRTTGSPSVSRGQFTPTDAPQSLLHAAPIPPDSDDAVTRSSLEVLPDFYAGETQDKGSVPRGRETSYRQHQLPDIPKEREPVFTGGFSHLDAEDGGQEFGGGTAALVERSLQVSDSKALANVQWADEAAAPRRLYQYSRFTLIGGVVADVASSYGGWEINPVRGTPHRFVAQDAAIDAGIVAGALLAQHIALRGNAPPWFRRTFTVLNFIVGGGRTAVAVRNWRVR
jgi:hypothetical protein